jgi:4-diphosphocytidyl-2-C-methyl-D-erythritol kinase
MPALRDCLRAGLERGAIGGVVSGSGPTVAFLIAGSPQAAALAADLNGSGHCRNAVAVAGGVHPEVTVASFPTLDSMASR